MRKCILCKGPNCHVDRDTSAFRVYVCDDCCGMEIISKGDGKAWWYHGARQPHQWPKAFLELVRVTAAA